LSGRGNYCRTCLVKESLPRTVSSSLQQAQVRAQASDRVEDIEVSLGYVSPKKTKKAQSASQLLFSVSRPSNACTCSTTSFNLTVFCFCLGTGSWNRYFKTLPSLKPISSVEGSVLEHGSCFTVTLTLERTAGGSSERTRRGVLACQAKGLKDAAREVRCVVFVLVRKLSKRVWIGSGKERK
jgi:hypothetical protein